MTERKQRFDIRLLLDRLVFVLILCICINAAMQRIYFSDFIPADGDFQNYNGYRRLLAGQVPFQDYYYYLGLAPLYLNIIPLWLLGGSFTASLFSTHFLAAAILAMTVYCIGRCSKAGKSFSLLLTLIVMMSAAGLIYNASSFTDKFDWLQYIRPGVSNRPVRLFLPFVLVGLGFLLVKPVRRMPTEKRLLFLGGVAGAGLGWSFDFGVSVYLAASYIVFLLWIRDSGRKMQDLFWWVSSSVGGCVIAVTCLTKGNFLNWAEYYFQAVGQSQFWYYALFGHEEKVLTLWDIPFNGWILSGVLAIIWLSVKLVKKSVGFRQLCLLFLLLTTMVVGYGYAVGNFKFGFFAPLYMVIGISFISVAAGRLISYLRQWRDKRHWGEWLYGGVVAVSLLITVPSFIGTAEAFHMRKGVYVPELSGYLLRWGDDILAEKKMLEGKTLFSVYASALEVVTGQFQPTGFDYAMHALGSKNREHYVQTYKQMNPDYICTLRGPFAPCQVWSKRVDWYFFREFLPYYRPCRYLPYATIWERQGNNSLDPEIVGKTKLSVEKIGDRQVLISVELPEEYEGFTADLKLSYTTAWNENRLRGMGLRKTVAVRDGWSGIKAEELYQQYKSFYRSAMRDDFDKTKAGQYLLPEESTLLYIPIKIENGRGFAELTSYPEGMTQLDIGEVTLENVIRDFDWQDEGMW